VYTKQFINNNKQQQQATTMSLRVSKPQCKICVNIGRDADHYTKQNGMVVCPVIKHNLCSRCGKKGHFPDHCERQRRPMEEKKVAKKTTAHPKHKFIIDTKQAHPKHKFIIDILRSDDDDDDDDDDDEEEDEPIINKRPEVKLAPWAIGKTVTQKKSSWAYDSDEE